MLARCILGMLKKDWTQRGKAFLFVWVVLFVLAAPLLPDDDLRLGGITVMVFTSAFYYAYNTYTVEINRLTLGMLLGLPVRPLHILIAKFVSLFSLCLITVNVPLALLFDLRMLFLYNVLSLATATVCMTASVISDSPFAPVAPLLPVLLAFQNRNAFDFVRPYEDRIAVIALAAVPVMVGICLGLFKRSARV